MIVRPDRRRQGAGLVGDGADADAGGTRRVRALWLRPRVPGGTRPWDCQADDGAWYVVKCINNPQDRRVAPPSKVLPTELFCARLGRLFDPPLCPEPVVVDVPEAVAAAAVHPRTRRRPAERAGPGPAFGSRRLDGAMEIKGDGGGRLARVPLPRLARVVLFHSWLRGVDVSALVTESGDIVSIDHGYFLGGHRWDPGRLSSPEPVRLKVASQAGPPERLLADPGYLREALEELLAVSEDRIAAAFAAPPPEWGVSAEVRALAATWVLRRRQGLARAIDNASRRRRLGR